MPWAQFGLQLFSSIVADAVASVEVHELHELIRANSDPSALNSNSLGSLTAGACTAMLGETKTSAGFVGELSTRVCVMVVVTTRVEPQPATAIEMNRAARDLVV